MGKKSVRQEVKERLLGLDSSVISQKSLAVSRNLKTLLTEQLSKSQIDGPLVGAYAPFQQEPLWFLSFTEADNYQFSLVHTHREIKLSYHSVKLSDIFEKCKKLELAQKILSEEVVPDLLLIPGIAFTEKLERLGRGRGYFDSYLSQYKGIRVGVFFECQKVKNTFSQIHDEKLDFIVTEQKIYKRG